jgi:predicted DNA-binding transcriptional regulator AlpA
MREATSPNHSDDAEPCATVSLRRACRRLGVSPRTVKRILAQQPGGFPRLFKIGGRLFMLSTELEAWLARASGHPSTGGASGR